MKQNLKTLFLIIIYLFIKSTSWGLQNETLLATYKTIARPVLEYGNTIWSPIISDMNLQKLLTTQNTALRIITGCTSDTNIQHLHNETETLPLKEHLALHSSLLKEKATIPEHPLHTLIQQTTCPRQMKQVIFANWNYPIININTDPQSINTDTVNRNLKIIHDMSVQSHLHTRSPNSIVGQ